MHSSLASLAVVVIVFLLVGWSLLLRSEGIAVGFRHMMRSLAVFAIAYLTALRVDPRNAIGWGTVSAVAFLLVFYPRRRRYISAAERRKAIARFELKTGKKFNPRRHEIDHQIAFSQGGNNSGRNLRVMERTANRQKGAKSIWWDVLGK